MGGPFIGINRGRMSRNNKSDFSPLDPKQAAFLTKRLEEAAARLPSLNRLRRKLLRLGGLELFAPKSDPDLDEILARGIVFDASSARSIRSGDSHCHENVSRLWAEAPHRYQIVTGYALSPDGLWRSHTWAAEGEHLVETSDEKVLYFGACLTAEHAARFAKANAYHDWRKARVPWPSFFAHHESRRARPPRWEKSSTPHPSARTGGLEHQRAVPRWKRNRDVAEARSGSDANGSVHLMTSENAHQHLLSGRADAVLDLLDEARQEWVTGASARSLRSRLLEIFRLLDVDDDTWHP
jgi:hypothetical protein